LYHIPKDIKLYHGSYFLTKFNYEFPLSFEFYFNKVNLPDHLSINDVASSPYSIQYLLSQYNNVEMSWYTGYDTNNINKKYVDRCENCSIEFKTNQKFYLINSFDKDNVITFITIISNIINILL